jgi:hypothetical protein
MADPIDLWAVDLDKPVEVLARYWNEFNCWSWPEELLSLKPEGYDDMPLSERHIIIRPAMHAISDKVPEKELLRYHHLHNLSRTETEFEAWWAKSEAGDI